METARSNTFTAHPPPLPFAIIRLGIFILQPMFVLNTCGMSVWREENVWEI
jgi:hypothetical protein